MQTPDTPADTPADTRSSTRYLAPDWFTRRVFNPLLAGLTRVGVSVWGSRLLEVAGRTTGIVRRTPVNVLTLDGERYLLAPRGTTQWVRNVRAAGGCSLRLSRRVERVAVVELPDAVKPPIIEAYLRRWRWEVGAFFPDLPKEPTETDLLAIAPGYPVFRIVPA